MKRDDEAKDGERVEGHVGDDLPVPEGVLQAFGIVRCIFDFIGKAVVLVDGKGQQEDAYKSPAINRDIEINRPACGAKRRKEREM